MSCGCKDHNHSDDLADRGQEYSLFKYAINLTFSQYLPLSLYNVYVSYFKY
jgi:hypothetical protein